jgi:hypothetical protein
LGPNEVTLTVEDAAGNLDEAQKTLLTTKRFDVYNQHATEINRLLESLNK